MKKINTILLIILIFLAAMILWSLNNKKSITQDTSKNFGTINQPLNSQNTSSALSKSKVDLKVSDRNDTVEDLSNTPLFVEVRWFFKNFSNINTDLISDSDNIIFNPNGTFDGQLMCTKFSGLYFKTSGSGAEYFFTKDIKTTFNQDCTVGNLQRANDTSKQFVTFLKRADDIRSKIIEISFAENKLYLNDSEYFAEFHEQGGI